MVKKNNPVLDTIRGGNDFFSNKKSCLASAIATAGRRDESWRFKNLLGKHYDYAVCDFLLAMGYVKPVKVC